MTRRHDALERICPDCGSYPGVACKGAKGPRKAVHYSRFKGEKPTKSMRVIQGGAGVDHAKVLFDELMQAHADSESYWFHELRKRCESPIEEMLLAALQDVARSRNPANISLTKGEWKPSDFGYMEASIFLQAKVGDYRVDFLVENRTPRGTFYTVVECDGHNYHERTKAQAMRDKRRDRWFTTNGFTVLRFTGSEIFADAPAVAEEIMNWIIGQ